jgi:uncharacterized protein YjbJ (UPF0337 family)
MAAANGLHRRWNSVAGSTLHLREREHEPTGANDMNKDRITGAAKKAAGAVEETTGKVLGDAKLVADGKSKKTEGKIQNAVGGAKDAVKSAARK